MHSCMPAYFSSYLAGKQFLPERRLNLDLSWAEQREDMI